MHVVDPGHQDLGAATAKTATLVEQEVVAEPGECWRHFGAVVVAESGEEAVGRADAPAKRRQRLEDVGLDERAPVGSAQVASADAEIDLEAGDGLENRCRHAGRGVEMQVGEMQDPIALESRGQAGEGKAQRAQPHIEAVGDPRRQRPESFRPS